MTFFADKTIVITGGTGSVGRALTKRLLSGAEGTPKKVIVFSRDEAKQHGMRLEMQRISSATDEVTYANFDRVLEFRIGDVRDEAAVRTAIRGAQIVVNAAALKQVPACEYFPHEAARTNIGGAESLIRAIENSSHEVEVAVGISTDKACHPINVMGMTKAIQERLLIAANLTIPSTRFLCVRYGNVLASRGSVIPLFHDQIRRGGPVTITSPEMTRFLLPLERAVETIIAAIVSGAAGEVWVPVVPGARILDVALSLIGGRAVETTCIGIRPGEKLHEMLVSSEESPRTSRRGDYLVIAPMLPEFRHETVKSEMTLDGAFTSHDFLLSKQETEEMLERHSMMLGGRGAEAWLSGGA